MGNSSSQISKQLINEYQELTFLTKQEIILAYKRFGELAQKEHRSNIESLRIPKERFLSLPELKANPFNDRICRVFSTSEQEDGSMSFEDFLDMLSAFSESATLEVKSHYAFRIFDFDGDGALNEADLEHLVNKLTGDKEDTKLSNSEMRQLIANVAIDAQIILYETNFRTIFSACMEGNEPTDIGRTLEYQLARRSGWMEDFDWVPWEPQHRPLLVLNRQIQILEESDIDKDGTINHSEFQHVISRSPDFISSFKIML